jgi:effector-binding domain-containing protein
MLQFKKSLFLVMGVFISAQTLMALEEPEYTVIKKTGDIEIREYNSYLVAETIVSSEFEEAGNDAFSRLFGYIDGENINNESIEMTAPVSQEAVDMEGQKIEMTVPVSQEKMPSGQYRIAFVMPGEFTLSTLPKPKDERIEIREIPAKKVAVIRYSGTWSEENYSENETLLYQFLREQGYKIKGKPMWARYDPPFMPWLFRRNEIMIEIN